MQEPRVRLSSRALRPKPLAGEAGKVFPLLKVRCGRSLTFTSSFIVASGVFLNFSCAQLCVVSDALSCTASAPHSSTSPPRSVPYTEPVRGRASLRPPAPPSRQPFPTSPLGPRGEQAPARPLGPAIPLSFIPAANLAPSHPSNLRTLVRGLLRAADDPGTITDTLTLAVPGAPLSEACDTR